jgi:hypothetical protein
MNDLKVLSLLSDASHLRMDMVLITCMAVV